MRKLAAAVFASPPTARYDEALEHFHTAEGLSPGFYVKNQLLIGKCYLALKDRPAAREWLRKTLLRRPWCKRCGQCGVRHEDIEFSTCKFWQAWVV